VFLQKTTILSMFVVFPYSGAVLMKTEILATVTPPQAKLEDTLINHRNSIWGVLPPSGVKKNSPSTLSQEG
jgi:hypothetical protein